MPMAEDHPHILVVDDDTRLRDLLRKYLSENQFRVTTAGDAAEARAKLAGLEFDLIVMDLMMPGENGLDLTQALRQGSDVPILILTAMGDPQNRIDGLERGADDYLAKPFEPRELVLRVRTILRRAATTAPGAPDSVVRFGDCAFDIDREELRRGDAVVRLTAAEASLLKTLARNPGVTLSRQDLIDTGEISGGSRTVDVQVTRLRRKVEADPKLPRYLQTVRGKGYVLRTD